MITRRRLGMRSAITPPTRETTVIGAVNDTIDRLRARGESFMSSTTSHDWVTRFMFIAMKDAKEPRKTQRKSRYARVSVIGRRPRRESGPEPERAMTAPASMSGDVSSVSPVFKGESSPRSHAGARSSLHAREGGGQGRILSMKHGSTDLVTPNASERWPGGASIL